MKWREMQVGNVWQKETIWRGRKKDWTINISAIYKDIWRRTEVLGYYFVADNKKLDRAYNSLWKVSCYPTLEECQMAAEQWVTHRVAIEQEV